MAIPHTFTTEATYWAHLLLHYPDAVVPIRDVLNAIKVKYLVEEAGEHQEVRYGFQDGSALALKSEYHGEKGWTFLYAEVVVQERQ